PVVDVFSPFPIHGIEPYLNIKRTRLTVASFIYGLLGFANALLLMGAIYGVIWPMNIGGKPSLAWPDFVPITFELTVLFAAHGMVFTFLAVAGHWPGRKARIFDERQTDDVFVVVIDPEKAGESATTAREVFNTTGAYEVSEKLATI
ncbi:MAG: DUF3341 domain-containing protein, partial [Bacteroidota bacterium]